MPRAARHAAAALALAATIVLPSLAFAEELPDLPIDVDVPSSIEVGKGRPYLTVTAREAVRKLSVTVRRSGAPTRRFRLGKLAAGASRTFRWPERPGVYNYGVTVKATHGDWTTKRPFNFELAYLPPIKVVLARSKVDLSKRQLTFQLNHPAASAELVVHGEGGRTLANVERGYGGARPGRPLRIAWPAVKGTIARIEVTARSTAGVWAGLELVPWAVSIPHEEVVFETDRFDIRPSEAPKLDSAVELIQQALAEHGSDLQAGLYVGGFTDTVGSKSHNRELSRNRAREIARYLGKRLRGIPIHYRGYGEEALATRTPDETPAAANRRAVYILGTQPPELSKSIRWGSWVRLSRGDHW